MNSQLSIFQYHIDRLIDCVLYNDFKTISKIFNLGVSPFDNHSQIEGKNDAIYMALYHNNIEMLEYLLTSYQATQPEQFKHKLNFWQQGYENSKIFNYFSAISYYDNQKAFEILYNALFSHINIDEDTLNKLGASVIINQASDLLHYTHDTFLKNYFSQKSYQKTFFDVVLSSLRFDNNYKIQTEEKNTQFLNAIKKIDPILFEFTFLLAYIHLVKEGKIETSHGEYAFSFKNYFQVGFNLDSFNQKNIKKSYFELVKLVPKHQHMEAIIYKTNHYLSDFQEALDKPFSSLFVNRQISSIVEHCVFEYLAKREKDAIENTVFEQSTSKKQIKI